jgi:hypothetical protein
MTPPSRKIPTRPNIKGHPDRNQSQHRDNLSKRSHNIRRDCVAGSVPPVTVRACTILGTHATAKAKAGGP